MTVDKPDRGQWGSKLQFILTCIGYAVGLGNIWRFPSLAYKNGGGAFLVPYLICSLLFGLPMLFLEFSIGQLTQAGPSKAFRLFKPAFQGVGWTMTTMALFTGIYYNVIIAWVVIYIVFIITGQSYKWTTCDNDWNKKMGQYCTSALEDRTCSELTPSTFFFNGSCISMLERDEHDRLYSERMISATEQFFENYILQRENSMALDIMNWKVLGALLFVWILTAICLMWGVKWIGRISLITATLPYIIIVILFVRAITLEGAEVGIRFYLTNPDWSYVLKPETWKDALTQVCYSLSVGFGGLLTLASYNKRDHNCFKDALIVCVADSAMSIIGGTAVFSTLGFIANNLHKNLGDVVQESTGLAFIAYPEAMSNMFLPWLWSFLFFAMLFLLGVSTQFGLTEGACTSLKDQFPSADRKVVVASVCAFNFAVGSVMCTGSGIYWLTLFNDYVTTFSLCIAVLLELFLVTLGYGIKEYRKDLIAIFGRPKNVLSKIFGPVGILISIEWLVIAPLLAGIVCVFAMYQTATSVNKYGKGLFIYYFPEWTNVVGWTIAVLPSLFVPLFFFVNWSSFKKKGKHFVDLFKVQSSHPSFARIQREKTDNTPSHIGYGNSVSPSEFNLQSVTKF